MKADLPDHRKFLRLVRLLNEPAPHALGYLLFMWRRAYQMGNPFLGDALDVEAAAVYSGEPGRFAKAAAEAGFIDPTDGGFVVHDLYHHAPEWARKRLARNGHGPAGARTNGGETGETPDTCPPNPRKHRRAADKGERREERGEREEATAGAVACPEPAEPAAGPAALAVAEPAVLAFPVVGTAGREWPLTAAKLAEYRQSFPGVDVPTELRKARQWLLDNPTRRKTWAGMSKFLGGWLGRAQDRGGGRSPTYASRTKAEQMDAYAFDVLHNASGGLPDDPRGTF